MLKDTLYYFFSATPQTLAGAVGLLAAFVVIRINAFNQLLHDHANKLFEKVSGDSMAREYYVRGDKPKPFQWYRDSHEAAREGAKSEQITQFLLTPECEAILTAAEGMQHRKNSLARDTRVALLASAFVIMLSLICLAGAHWLATCPSIAYLLVVGVLAGAAYCVWCYVALIDKALREA